MMRFRCRGKRTTVLCLSQQMFNIVATVTSRSLITVSLPTGSVYAHEKEKENPGFYLSVFPDFSLIAD